MIKANSIFSIDKVISIFLILALGLVLTPFVREKLKSNSGKEQRAQVKGDLTGAIHPKGPWIDVVKFVQNKQIKLKLKITHFDLTQEDFLDIEPQEFDLGRVLDAHALVKESLVNLALVNIDDDLWQELIVPFYTQELIPRLYVYKYDPQIRQFIRLNDKD